MNYKLLNTQKKELTDYINIRIKYGNKIDENGKVRFSEIDFKSILSIIFGIQLHLSELVNQEDKDNSFFSDKNYYFNISKEFGSHLIDNLEGFNLEWFNEIQNQSYVLNKIINNETLLEFINEALIDQMNIRQWEYGKYFLEQFSKNFENVANWPANKHKIINPLKNKKNVFWDKIHENFKTIKTPIENYEVLILAFFIKNKIDNNMINMLHFNLLGAISMQKMQKIFIREKILIQAMNEIVILNQNLNRGKGGPKL